MVDGVPGARTGARFGTGAEAGETGTDAGMKAGMGAGMEVGMYVHHHGSGHAMRARALSAALAKRGIGTTTLGSRDDAGIRLPLDPEAVPGADPTVGGALHWAPPRSAGMARRMAMISDYLAGGQLPAELPAARPAAFPAVLPAALHVDVSVEVALLARLHGTPVTVQAMPGDRRDAPHVLGHSVADGIIAAWPEWVPLPAHLEPVADRVRAVGGITRFEGRDRTTDGADFAPGRMRVTVLGGTGGGDLPDGYFDAVAAACPDADVKILDAAHGWVDDPWPYLCASDVVVAAAGQNSVADIAAAGARAIIIPRPRPFGEQEATARVLSDAGLALVPCGADEDPPAPEDWPALLDRAPNADWSTWQTDGAADRAAAVIEGVARDR